MERDKRNIVGVVGTVSVHLLIILLMFLVYIQRPEQEGESGVPVLLGNVTLSKGVFDPATMTKVDVMPQPVAPPVQEVVPEVTEQDMLTQTEEETIAIKPKSEEKKEKETVQPKEEVVVPKEKTAEELKAEEEKAAAEAAARQVAGAFGKGLQMEDKGVGDLKQGNEGSTEGNATVGATQGLGGYGTFDLDGRSLGEGGLPRPVYDVQDEGRVVVTITVNPQGEVIGTSINRRTNTVNASLRKAAEDAARKARFNSVGGINNQMGTITYYFKLK